MSASECSRRASVPPKVVGDRICAVCGDRANGYNFGVLTCESCKAFFRRNAAREEDIKCPFSNCCEITSASRRFCQACRLNKCFAVGMSSDCLVEAKPPKTVKSKRRKVEDTKIKEEQDEKVSVPKAYLDSLKKKANENQQSCCCDCTCGFYPPGTRLVAAYVSSSSENTSSQMFQSGLSPPDTQSTCSPVPVFSPSPPLGGPMALRPAVFQQSPSPFNNVPSPSFWSSSTSVSDFHPFPFPDIAVYSNCPPTEVLNDWAYMHSHMALPIRGLFLIEHDKCPWLFRPIVLPVPPPYVKLPHSLSRHTNFSLFVPPTDFCYGIPANPSAPAISVSALTQIDYRLQRYHTLTFTERALLRELHIINEPLKAPLEKNYGSSSLTEVVRIAEEAIKRIISMTATLRTFSELDPLDKRQLVKSGFCELLIVRGLMAYDKKSQTWNHLFATNSMEIKIDVIKEYQETFAMQHYEKHKELLNKFSDDIRNHIDIMLLVMAIVVFRPELPNLQNHDRICSTQKTYFEVMLKVLEMEFSQSRAHSLYCDLMQLIVELQGVNESMLRLFYGLGPQQLEPLIKELCDMCV